MACINRMFTDTTIAGMHESLMRMLACARIASRSTRNPIDSPGRLAEVLEVSSATMTNWKKRGVSKDGALKAELTLGCRPAFVLEGRGEPFTDMPPLPAGITPMASLAYPDLYDAEATGVAHLLRQARKTVELPSFKWEELMTADLSQPFELEVMDDALAPDIFKGCIAILDPARAPEPAWPVLVRDRDGNHYLRDYEAGPGGRWSAVPRARGYSSMDSESAGLTIIAAMKGYMRPRPEELRWRNL